MQGSYRCSWTNWTDIDPSPTAESDTLDRTGPHVSGGEYAGVAGLQQEWLPPGGPVWGLRQGGAGAAEILAVAFDLLGEPVGPFSGRACRAHPVARKGLRTSRKGNLRKSESFV
jgi:hypothetical protein